MEKMNHSLRWSRVSSYDDDSCRNSSVESIAIVLENVCHINCFSLALLRDGIIFKINKRKIFKTNKRLLSFLKNKVYDKWWKIKFQWNEKYRMISWQWKLCINIDPLVYRSSVVFLNRLKFFETYHSTIKMKLIVCSIVWFALIVSIDEIRRCLNIV